MTRGKRQGAARTTSKAMSWPAEGGWLASQYWAALTIRRRCFAVTVQAAASAVFRRFTSTKASRLPFSATKVDLPDRGCVAPRHDAIAL